MEDASVNSGYQHQTSHSVPMETDQSMDIECDLPRDVQQEIEDLCHFVPEVSQHFKIINKIGEGTFSSVFLARLRHHPEVQDMFALKHIIPTSHPNRILGELRCLQLIGGQENVMGLELCLRNKDHIVIVMRYFPHHKFQDYLPKLDVGDVREYMRNLLVALRRVHQFDIIHRDIKPSNFLFDPVTKQYTLVDFGLAHDAPVKLQDANKGRSPLVVEHRSGHGGRSNGNARQAKQRVSSAEASVCSSKGKVGGEDVPLEESEGQRSVSAGKSTSGKPSPSKRPSSSGKTTIKSPHRKVSAAQDENYSTTADDAVFSPPSLPPPRPDNSKQGQLSLTRSKEPLSPSKDSRANTPAGRIEGLSKRGHPSPRRALLAHKVMAAQLQVDRKRGQGGEERQTASRRPGHRQGSLATCQCFGRPTICSICNARSTQSAPRAGTPGFRAPEVLMKHPQQSTAVDMWSAGVIFLSLLSARYPFFRANDDLTCLSQIISLLGTEEVQEGAGKYGKLLTCRPVTRPLDLKHLCLRLRTSPEVTEGKAPPVKQWMDIPDTAIDLLHKLLDPNPATRITADRALQHAFLVQ